jgi:anti-sigma B factor antagonist
MHLNYSLNYRGNIPLITLAGRFDAEVCDIVKVRFVSLVTPQQPNLVIDMSGVTFVDSLGLATLVSGLKLCRKNHGLLRLVNLQSQVRYLFEMTRLDQAFELFENVDDAFSDFSRG